MPTVSRRRVAGGLAALLVGVGLVGGDTVSDARWLALLWLAWLALLVAVWPRLRPGVEPSARAIVQTATVLATLFVALAVQLGRTQVVRSRAIAEKVGTDPATGDVLANPRLAGDAIRLRRGRIVDRAGHVLAESDPEGDGEEEAFRRVVPEPAAAAVVGYFSPLLYGTAGLERAYDAELGGREGPDALRRAVAEFVGRPRQGLELRLSLDLGLQRIAQDLLAGRPGAAVLLDATTGATLALATTPGYDPNRLATTGDAERPAAQSVWAGLTADPAAPLLFRPTSGLYAPGSTFKTLVAAAAIEQGLAGPETTYDDAGELVVDGHRIPEFNRPDDTRTVWTLEEAVGWSLNVVFAQVGLQLGAGGLATAAERWGFAAPLPYDLPTATSRLEAAPGFLQNPVGLAETAFGQGQLLATPLQMALVAAGIANGGSVMRPWLVGAMADAGGEEVWRARPGEWRRPVRPETAAAVARMMTWGVRQGGAGAAAIPGVEVGAKTGTAEAAEGRPPHAWFIGFAGRHAVAVVLDNGGGGGANALPVGRELLRAALEAA